MVALLIFSLLMTATMVTMTNVLGITYQTSATQTETRQVINLGTTLDRLIRSEVEPGPAVSGVPDPGFSPAATSTSSMTFYTDTGDPNGPALVVAAESTTPNPCTGGGCNIPTYTFTVTETAATPGTCPTTAGGGAGCTYLTLPARQIVAIHHLSNTPTQPIFTYTVLHTDGTTTTPTPTQITTASPNGYFDPCGPGPDPATTCPADAIQSVEFSFLLYDQAAPHIAPGTSGITGYDTTVYRSSSTSYQYSQDVG